MTTAVHGAAGWTGGGGRPWLRPAIPAAVFVLTFLAFLPTLRNDLVDIDDRALLVDNTAYRKIDAESLGWMFRTTLLGHWQPLTWLSYAIDWQVTGGTEDPASEGFRRAVVAFHRTSMLLHAANAALLSLVAFRLLGAAGLGRGDWTRLSAAAGALAWAAHPLRVESVSWATERRDVLSVFFLLLALLAYLRAFPPGTTRPASVRFYACSAGLLLLSLLSKPWGMTFFVVATLIDWYPLRRLPPNPLAWLRPGARSVLLQKVPYLVLGLASARLATWAIISDEAMRSLEDWPLASRVVQAFYGLVWYPAKTLWPARLAPLYELRHGLNPLEPQYLACYAAVLLGGAAVLLYHRRMPAVASAAAIYAVTVAPVLGLTQAGDQFVADRYAYLSTISLFLLGAGGLAMLLRRLPAERRLASFVGALAFVAVSGGATWLQTRAWRDSITLWGEAVRKDPTRMMAQINYGVSIEQAGRLEEAIEHYRMATRLDPRDGRGWYVLGKALRQKGDLAGAEEAYRNSAASTTLPQVYMPLVNLGNLLLQTGRPDEAMASYRAAVEAVEHPRPGSVPSPVPYLALGAELERRGNVEGARSAFERAFTVAEHELLRPGGKNRGINASARDEAVRRLAQLPPRK